jgi:hypothetical protein
MKDIIQLKITLHRTDPPIWRRVLVPKDTTLFELHHIIQIAMGWDNYHMFEFKINNYSFGTPYDDLNFAQAKLIDASDVSLDEVLINPKQTFDYIYDFGDNWTHKIVFEKSILQDNKLIYPVCIDGELNCPPEDCGGIPGFYNMLDIITRKRHPEKKNMLEWLGGHYDPSHFDIALINSDLITLDDYIAEWLDGLDYE